jgi:hypothetical protein
VGTHLEEVHPRNKSAAEKTIKEVIGTERGINLKIGWPSLSADASGKNSFSKERHIHHSPIEWHSNGAIVWWNYTLDDYNHQHGVRDFDPEAEELPRVRFRTEPAEIHQLNKDEVWVEISSFWSLSTQIENGEHPILSRLKESIPFVPSKPRYRNFFHRLGLVMPANLLEDADYHPAKYYQFDSGEKKISLLTDKGRDVTDHGAMGCHVPEVLSFLSGLCSFQYHGFPSISLTSLIDKTWDRHKGGELRSPENIPKWDTFSGTAT